MQSKTDPAALAECIAPLDDEDCEVLHRYWDRVIEDVWSALPVQSVPRAASLAELEERRRRREARRAMTRVAAAGRAVRFLPSPVRVAAPGRAA
ncbi:MAG: hypothetical protein AB7L91_14580 [Dehalococcoidia bacterium]